MFARILTSVLIATVCVFSIAVAQDGLPSTETRKQADNALATYFSHLRHERYDEAWAMMAMGVGEERPFDKFLSEKEAIYTRLGAPWERLLVGTEWRIGSKATVARTTVSFDFAAEHAGGQLSCGRITLVEQADRTFLVQNDDETLVPNLLTTSVSDRLRGEIFSAPGCRTFRNLRSYED